MIQAHLHLGNSPRQNENPATTSKKDKKVLKSTNWTPPAAPRHPTRKAQLVPKILKNPVNDRRREPYPGNTPLNKIMYRWSLTQTHEFLV